MARYNQHQRDVAYRIYISECLRILTENTASNGQSYMAVKFDDLLHPKKKDERTAEMIVADTIKKAGIKVI